MDIATASVVVAGGVGALGVISPLVTTLLTGTQAKNARRDARFDETRERVDAVCAAVSEVHTFIPARAEHYHPPSELQRRLHGLASSRERLYLEAIRLQARVGGDDPMVLALEVLQRTLKVAEDQVYDATRGIRRQGLAEQQKVFVAALNNFCDTAAERLGPARD